MFLVSLVLGWILVVIIIRLVGIMLLLLNCMV